MLSKNLENCQRTYKKYPQIKFYISSENYSSHKTVFEIFTTPQAALTNFVTFLLLLKYSLLS